jgi:hypothetical protein
MLKKLQCLATDEITIVNNAFMLFEVLGYFCKGNFQLQADRSIFFIRTSCGMDKELVSPTLHDAAVEKIPVAFTTNSSQPSSTASTRSCCSALATIPGTMPSTLWTLTASTTPPCIT